MMIVSAYKALLYKRKTFVSVHVHYSSSLLKHEPKRSLSNHLVTEKYPKSNIENGPRILN